MDIKWETSPDPHLLRWPVLTISVFSSSHIYLCDTIYCACISGSRFKQYYCLLAMRAGDIAYLDIYTFSLSSPSHFKNNYSMTFSCCYFKIPCNILKSISSINCFISLSTLLSQFITVIPLLLLKVWNIYIICFVTIVNCNVFHVLSVGWFQMWKKQWRLSVLLWLFKYLRKSYEYLAL